MNLKICVEKNLFDDDENKVIIENFGSITAGVSSSLSSSQGNFSSLSSTQGNFSSLSTSQGSVSPINTVEGSGDVIISGGATTQESTTTRLINYSKTNFGTDQIVFDIGLANLTTIPFLEALQMINLEGNTQYVEDNAQPATQNDINCAFSNELLSSFPMQTPLSSVISLIETEGTTIDNVNLTVSEILSLFTEYNNASTTTTQIDINAVASALTDNTLTVLEIAALVVSDDLIQIDGDEQELQQEELMSSGSIILGRSSGEVIISVPAQAARERARALIRSPYPGSVVFPRDQIEPEVIYETARVPLPRTRLPNTGYSKKSLSILKQLPVEALPEILKTLPKDDLVARTQIRLIQVMRWTPEPLITVSATKVTVSDQFLLAMPVELLWQMVEDLPANDMQTRARITKILRAKKATLPSKKTLKRTLPTQTKPKTEQASLKTKPLPPAAEKKINRALSESKTIPLTFAKRPTVRAGAPWKCDTKEKLTLLKRQALPGEEDNIGVIETPYTFEEIEAVHFQKEYEKLFVSLLKMGGSLCKLKSKAPKWDKEKDAKLLSLIGGNSEIEDIANIFNTDPVEIRDRLRFLNYETIEPKKQLDIYEKNKDYIYRRFKYFLKNGIIGLRSSDTNLVDAMVQRDFIIKKITISFSPEQNVEWTPLIKLEGSRDVFGNVLPIDPLEYKIREMSISEAVKTVIKERLAKLLDLEFIFVDEKEEYDPVSSAVVRIGFNKDKGSWSLIGMDNFFSVGKQTMNFSWLDSGTIIHEFCHVLGLIHEHQNPAGKDIDWNEDNVYKWSSQVYGWDKKTTYLNIIKKYDTQQVNSTDYDGESIMLYFFPPQLTLDNKGTQQNLRFSMEDIRFLVSVLPPKNINAGKFYQDIYGIKQEGVKGWGEDGLTAWNFFYWFVVIILLGFILKVLVDIARLSRRKISM